MNMEWKPFYLDLALIPAALLMSAAYHWWLLRRIRSSPHRTNIGIAASGHRLWVLAMLKDNDKKNVLVVQTLRNMIMGSTLMATTSVLLCTGLAAVLSSTYTVKKPLADSVVGAHGAHVLGVKYAVLLAIFLFAFVCYSLSIRFLVHVGFLTNVGGGAGILPAAMSPEYVCGLLDRGAVLNTVGNRLFYSALPLLLWIFGPVLAFLCSAALLPVLYSLDVVDDVLDGGVKENGNGCMV